MEGSAADRTSGVGALSDDELFEMATSPIVRGSDTYAATIGSKGLMFDSQRPDFPISVVKTGSDNMFCLPLEGHVFKEPPPTDRTDLLRKGDILAFYAYRYFDDPRNPVFYKVTHVGRRVYWCRIGRKEVPCPGESRSEFCERPETFWIPSDDPMGPEERAFMSWTSAHDQRFRYTRDNRAMFWGFGPWEHESSFAIFAAASCDSAVPQSSNIRLARVTHPGFESKQ
mmetsp:Transcript_30253/g.96536  ORF Transcript_30253/g.96536 Transcript_30253/m.96536 type:complete len:227 (+) Transcript_30253:161-841(+)